MEIRYRSTKKVNNTQNTLLTFFGKKFKNLTFTFIMQNIPISSVENKPFNGILSLRYHYRYFEIPSETKTVIFVKVLFEGASGFFGELTTSSGKCD